MPSLGNVNKNYPYPVLGNLDDFDSSNNFTLRVRYGARNGQFEFTCNLEFDSFRTDYDELIKDRKIHFCVLIFNAQTFFRSYFSGFEKQIRFNVPQGSLRGKVNITAFMSANESIEKFSPSGQNKDFYGENSFDIDEGSILAVSNTIGAFIEPHFKKQNKDNAKHIITFARSKELTNTFEVRNWGEDQLIVEMPKSLFDIWSSLVNEQVKYIHHCAIYLPILTDAITKIELEDGKEQFGDLKWYFVIDKLIKEAGYPDDMDASTKAQKLMKGPFKPFVKEIDGIMDTLIGEE